MRSDLEEKRGHGERTCRQSHRRLDSPTPGRSVAAATKSVQLTALCSLERSAANFRFCCVIFLRHRAVFFFTFLTSEFVNKHSGSEQSIITATGKYRAKQVCLAKPTEWNRIEALLSLWKRKPHETIQTMGEASQDENEKTPVWGMFFFLRTLRQ